MRTALAAIGKSRTQRKTSNYFRSPGPSSVSESTNRASPITRPSHRKNLSPLDNTCPSHEVLAQKLDSVGFEIPASVLRASRPAIRHNGPHERTSSPPHANRAAFLHACPALGD